MANKQVKDLGTVKQFVKATDLIPIQEAGGTTRHADKEALIALENANWGHSGAVITGFSPVLPYAVTAGVDTNLTTDKGGFFMEYPADDPNFKWDAATQRFYSDKNIQGQATYLARLVLTVDLAPPKKGESVEFKVNRFTNSTTGTPADASILISSASAPIANTADANIVTDVIFFSDSDTFTHGVGFEFNVSENATIRKHSIFIARIR